MAATVNSGFVASVVGEGLYWAECFGCDWSSNDFEDREKAAAAAVGHNARTHSWAEHKWDDDRVGSSA